MISTKSFTACLAASLLALAACGGSDDASTATDASATEQPAAAADGATFGGADVMFAQGMIPHHEQAVEMADIALDPAVGASPAVTELAQRVKAGQDPEIAVMSGLLESWGQPMEMDMGDGHDMSSMVGMMSMEDMEALRASTGAEFDRLWLEMMILHHEGAITMAQDVQAAGVNPEAVALAGEIITAQQGEIAEMNALLGG